MGALVLRVVECGLYFFFQAKDGIRDSSVTGVQTCALPILRHHKQSYDLSHMIIDCHGHYTTAPNELQSYRDSQIAGLKDPSHVPSKGMLKITDDQIDRKSVV